MWCQAALNSSGFCAESETESKDRKKNKGRKAERKNEQRKEIRTEMNRVLEYDMPRLQDSDPLGECFFDPHLHFVGLLQLTITFAYVSTDHICINCLA